MDTSGHIPTSRETALNHTTVAVAAAEVGEVGESEGEAEDGELEEAAQHPAQGHDVAQRRGLRSQRRRPPRLGVHLADVRRQQRRQPQEAQELEQGRRATHHEEPARKP